MKNTPASRALVAREVYEAVYYHVESFRRQHIGADLAYLLGAILHPDGLGFVHWGPGFMRRRPALYGVLVKAFAKEHPVWNHIRL